MLPDDFELQVLLFEVQEEGWLLWQGEGQWLGRLGAASWRKCSWWRLDGYTTYDEDGDSTDQESKQLVDDVREEVELSLSNSEDNGSNSEDSASE